MRYVTLLGVNAFLVAFLVVNGVRAELVDVSLCPVLNLTAGDATSSLPSSLVNASLGSTFYLEIWTIDKGTPLQGISGGFLDIAYSTNKLDATAMDHGLTYTTLTSGTISDSAGLVSDFGGNALNVGTPGKTEWARLGWVTFVCTAPGQAILTPQASSLDDFSRFSGGSVSWSQINAPSVNINIIPEPSSFILIAVASLTLTAAGCLRRRE